jgi:hypothetical protein
VSLFNLSLGEVIALFGTASALLVTLYLLDRSRRRQVVATLRFWKPAEDVTSVRHKRRIQQPWSLLLQLISIALLLLAIAQLELGDRSRSARDHIVVLDTSAWMGARTSRGTLMDDARSAALAWLRAVPSSDRVMIVRADALATPVTSLDTNHAVLERAIRDSKPGAAALNLDQAIEFAERVQRLHSQHSGEIVYVGAGRIPAAEGTVPIPSNLRVIPITSPVENVGLRKIGLRRADAETWEVFVSAKNYGSRPKPTQLSVQFGGAPVGSRTLTLPPGGEQQSSFSFRTRAAGWLEARLLINDAFPEDDRATLEIPAQRSLSVAVYSSDPELLRPVLSASPNITPVFRAPAAYDSRAKADVVVLDRFAPPEQPAVASIWIDPPAQESPIRVKTTVYAAKLTQWTSNHDLGTGLRTKDLEFETATVFAPSPDDIPIASVNSGPVILARPQSASSPKLVVFGFHPALTAMRYELATPLLFANVLRWINPAVFQRWELNAGTVGTVEAHLDTATNPDSIRVTSDTAGSAVPYSLHRDLLRFFAGTPGNYRVQAGDREIAYSLTLPDVGDSTWTLPAKVRRGVPRSLGAEVSVVDLWPWLALAGAAGLLVEWILYGRGRREAWLRRRTTPVRTKVLQRKAS